MAGFDGTAMQAEFKEVFPEGLTVRQMWFLIKAAKHCRLRCRNNAALNNWANRNFQQFTFREVPKEYNGKSYMGLEIKSKNSGEVVSSVSPEE